MEILRDVLVILHFVGLASLLGGFLVQMKPATKSINMAMFHGVMTQLVTGLALVAVLEMSDLVDNLDHVKVAVKLLVTLVIAVLVVVHRKRAQISVPLWAAIGALTFINIIVAVVW